MTHVPVPVSSLGVFLNLQPSSQSRPVVQVLHPSTALCLGQTLVLQPDLQLIDIQMLMQKA